MANKAISELPQALNVNNQDLFVLEQSGIAKKLTAETFITEQGIIDALAEALDGHGGIQSVTLLSVSGRIRTYLITFTDETTTTFQVYDGTSIERIEKTNTAGLTDTYTVFMNDGTTTFFTVTNGEVTNAQLESVRDEIMSAVYDCLKYATFSSPNAAVYLNRIRLKREGIYTLYDYIKFTGSTAPGDSAIFANVDMSSDYIYSTTLFYTNTTSSAFIPLFGNRSPYASKNLAVYVKPYISQIGYWFGGVDSPNQIYALSPNTKTILTINPVGMSETYPTYATIIANGTEYSTGSTVSGQIWNPHLGLFSPATSATTSGGFATIGQRIGEFTIKKKNGDYVADLVPAFNGTYYGFLDLVTYTFYYNETYYSLYEGGNWE